VTVTVQQEELTAEFAENAEEKSFASIHRSL
jgi:hypothetical protein